MARKRNSQSDSPIKLDSLMDALTNVVAVMILVLVLVQADVSQKVQKFFDDMMPATAEELAASEELVVSLEKQQQALEAAMKAEAPQPVQIEAQKMKIARLEESIQERVTQFADLKALLAAEKGIRSEHESLIKNTGTLRKRIAELEGQLSELPALKGDEPTVVNIPNSRPVPENAKVYYAIARKGRIHIIDPHTPLRLFEKEFKRRKKDWLIRRVKVKGAADRYIYDGRKIAAFFQNYNWRNTRGQKVSIEALPTSWRLRLVITPDLENGGTPTAELATPGSGYAKAAAIIKRDFNGVLFFWVAPGSFDTYLRARELADLANIPSGWKLFGNPSYKQVIEDISIQQLTKPSPPDKKKPQPPPVEPKLD